MVSQITGTNSWESKGFFLLPGTNKWKPFSQDMSACLAKKKKKIDLTAEVAAGCPAGDKCVLGCWFRGLLKP